MSDPSSKTTREQRLERVRILAPEIAARRKCAGAQYLTPCFVECDCWAEAERVVNAWDAQDVISLDGARKRKVDRDNAPHYRAILDRVRDWK